MTFDLPKAHILNLDKTGKKNLHVGENKQTIAELTDFAHKKNGSLQTRRFKLLIIYLLSHHFFQGYRGQ